MRRFGIIGLVTAIACVFGGCARGAPQDIPDPQWQPEGFLFTEESEGLWKAQCYSQDEKKFWQDKEVTVSSDCTPDPVIAQTWAEQGEEKYVECESVEAKECRHGGVQWAHTDHVEWGGDLTREAHGIEWAALCTTERTWENGVVQSACTHDVDLAKQWKSILYSFDSDEWCEVAMADTCFSPLDGDY